MAKNKRQFLKWCVELANSDEGNLTDLSARAIRDGFFIDNQEIVERNIKESFKALRENVIAFATAMTAKESFLVEFEKEGGTEQLIAEADHCYLLKNTSFNGKVKYYLKHPPLISQEDIDQKKKRLETMISKSTVSNIEAVVKNLLNQWQDSKSQPSGVTEDLDLNYLVFRFYEAVSEYCKEKKCGILELPLRNCKEEKCGKPFFGRLRKQEFCCKRHGEIYHGKKAHRKRKNQFMDRKTFEREMMRADTMMDAENNRDYWMGYKRGLRRKFHGENFGTETEHKLWLSAIESTDKSRRERGRGYNDGYKFRESQGKAFASEF